MFFKYISALLKNNEIYGIHFKLGALTRKTKFMVEILQVIIVYISDYIFF